MRIGLTGGIGSGKTAVARIFETLGVPVYYADDAAKRVMNENEQLRVQIETLFGEEAYAGNSLNRQFLASIVFSDPHKLSQLNALVHPVTLADAEDWVMQQSAPYTIKEAAIIFESDAWKQVDKVIGVQAPYELRLSRAMKRDHLSAEAVQARMAKQMDEEEKMKRTVLYLAVMSAIPRRRIYHPEKADCRSL